MSRMASRKFLLAVGFETVCVLLLIFALIDAALFAELSKFALGGYLGANVAHRAVEGVAEYLSKKGAAP